ncbi:unnamed protein product [Diamesa tonsa]
MERRNLPRKARDIKRDHSDEDDFESPVVKKKPTKKQAGKTDAKKVVTKTLKNNINNDDDEEKTPVLKKRGKTQSAKLPVTEDKIAEEDVPENVRGSGKKSKLIVGKEDTDAPATKKKKLPSKEVDVDIPAQKKKGSSSKGKDEVPLKVLNDETPVSDVPAPTKKKMPSKVKKVSAPKESDVGKSDDIPASKAKKVTKSKKESTPVESDNEVPAAKKNKKPSKGKIESVPEETDAVVLDSEIPAVSKKKVAVKGKKEVVPKEPTEKGIKKLQNSTETNYANIDFNINEAANTKICSFNVAGVRAFVKKGGQEYFEKERPDIICLQELKCGTLEELPEEILIKGYHAYWNLQKGFNGVGILSKKLPISFTNGIGDKEMDEESRMVTLEYEKFFIVCVYAVNAGRGLTTIDKKMKWNTMFDKYVQDLDKRKAVIIAGDMNCAHEEIDLANPKTNKKSAGFTPEEREGFSKLLSLGFVDTFRHFYPKKVGAYTFWTYMGSARSKNVGWRLDYFLVSNRFMTAIKDNSIRSEVLGSDHCPIVLHMNL